MPGFPGPPVFGARAPNHCLCREKQSFFDRDRVTGIPIAMGILQSWQEAPMEASRTAPVHANNHAESRKAYRDPTVPRRLYLPASVRLRGAREVLRLAASRHLGLDKIARLSGVSRGHFLRLFRQAGRSSPMRQVRRMELDQVVEMLQTTDLSLVTLAKEGPSGISVGIDRDLHSRSRRRS